MDVAASATRNWPGRPRGPSVSGNRSECAEGRRIVCAGPTRGRKLPRAYETATSIPCRTEFRTCRAAGPLAGTRSIAIPRRNPEPSCRRITGENPSSGGQQARWANTRPHRRPLFSPKHLPQPGWGPFRWDNTAVRLLTRPGLPGNSRKTDSPLCLVVNDSGGSTCLPPEQCTSRKVPGCEGPALRRCGRKGRCDLDVQGAPPQRRS